MSISYDYASIMLHTILYYSGHTARWNQRRYITLGGRDLCHLYQWSE